MGTVSTRRRLAMNGKALPLALLALLLPAVAAPPGPAPDLSWLQGCWTGRGFGGDVAECWIAAPGSARMTGVFHLVQDGKAVVSEFFAVDRFGDAYELRLKHFHSDLRGWESQDEFVAFRYLRSGPNIVEFDGLSYRLDESGTLRVAVTTRRDGVASTSELALRRHAP
ncbi:MAG TPA: DUF6265 family protein [Xanthomonadales bacterium]|nr:DUF6265 family protein [Xanthomonadales bacterium]